MSDMNNKVALITGASSGIGRASAEIEARGGTATAIQTDVSVAADVERMVDHAIRVFGRLDYAVNNAGIEGKFAGITELAEEEWDRVLGINIKGTFLGMKHEARAMLAAGHGGSIVNVGSVNSFLGFAAGQGLPQTDCNPPGARQ